MPSWQMRTFLPVARERNSTVRPGSSGMGPTVSNDEINRSSISDRFKHMQMRSITAHTRNRCSHHGRWGLEQGRSLILLRRAAAAHVDVFCAKCDSSPALCRNAVLYRMQRADAQQTLAAFAASVQCVHVSVFIPFDCILIFTSPQGTAAVAPWPGLGESKQISAASFQGLDKARISFNNRTHPPAVPSTGSR
jgi:hypothetical protein